MKKILTFVVFVLLGAVLTKMANDIPSEPEKGVAFSLKGVHVLGCSPTEIIVVDQHQTMTHLDTDDSWPDCSNYQANEVLDFYLARGEKTHFIEMEQVPWWRKI